MAERIVALVPMRHHSARIPGKNLRLLGGVPLFHHILRTLESVTELAEVVVDTDSEPVRQELRQHFPAVHVLERPRALCGDAVPMTQILHHDASLVEASSYLQTHATNPFLKSETVGRALQRWRQVHDRHDSLFSVSRLQARLWDQAARPINHDAAHLIQTQQLPPVFLENSCLYLFPRELILSRHRRIGERPFLFELDPAEALDIDEARDFALAERLMRAVEVVG